jgi:osmotically-inducible protein OsmY
MRALTLAGRFVLVVCVAAACSPKTEERAREAGQQAGEAAKTAGAAAASAAHDAVHNTEKAVDAVKASRAVNDAADAAAAAVQTAQVKAALVADSSVEARGIDVDTDAHSKTITLKGQVPSEAQKTAAGRIAKAAASTGYGVVNDLTVRR